MTQRFEYADRTSRKFWEVTVRGSAVTVRYGRMGSDGQTQRTEYADRATARSAAATRIAEKVRKGYREIGGAIAPAATATTATERPAKTGAAKPRATPVSTKQLAELRKLLGQDDGDAVRQGIALAVALDNRAVWNALAAGCSVRKGEMIVARDGEVYKRVKKDYRVDVALRWGEAPQRPQTNATSDVGHAERVARQRETSVKQPLSATVCPVDGRH